MEKEKQPLIVKYRPKTFAEFRGNQIVVMGLSMLLKKGATHSFLIIGPSGSGKTTLAHIIAKELGCENSEFYKMNTANTRGIDTIRDMIENAAYEPLLGKVKVFLLDECHQITGPAAEALLKFLEDPPKHVYIVLCTTAPYKLLATIKNRCSTWPVTLLNQKQIEGLLDDVSKQEKKVVDPEVKEAIALVAEGCPRQALKILDQVMELPDKLTQLKIIMDSTVNEVQIATLGEMILDADVKWNGFADILSKMLSNVTDDDDNTLQIQDRPKEKSQPKMTTEDAEAVRRKLLGFFMWKLLNNRNTPEVKDKLEIIMDIFSKSLYDTGKSGLILACYKAKKV